MEQKYYIDIMNMFDILTINHRQSLNTDTF